MPINKGAKARTKQGFAENIGREMAYGKKKKQAVAIAYAEANKKSKKKK